RPGDPRVFLNRPGTGARDSALSYFGLVPAALQGVDVAGLLDRALRMMRACAADVPAQENPGVALGAAMGELARRGRDKVTLLVAAPVAALGMWLEQLMAESTGKAGTGLLPVADEPPGDPAVDGEDRLVAPVRRPNGADDRRDPEGVARPGPARGLHRLDGVPDRGTCDQRGTPIDPGTAPRRHAAGHHARIRAPVPALDRAVS